MHKPAIVSREEWLAARKDFLEFEKAVTRASDGLARQRQRLPWVKIDKDYRFHGESGEVGLAELFRNNSQLLVYHFMFAPDWEEGCPSCSFWADNFNETQQHLDERDITLAAVSRAPLEKLLAYRERMGWSFDWYSSLGSDFNFDFNVSFSESELQTRHNNYNFETIEISSEEAPGLSTFYRDENGELFHTYSTYARGLDHFNAAYQLMDVAPKGRNEEHLDYNMAWLRRKDEYDQ